MNHKFSKKEHLKRKKLIDQLFAEGKSIKAFPIRLVYVQTTLPHPEIAIQAGVSVSKRNHKLAVTRNRIKRLMREAYRKNKPSTPIAEKQYAFMLLYMSREVISYVDMEKTMQKLMQKFTQAETEA